MDESRKMILIPVEKYNTFLNCDTVKEIKPSLTIDMVVQPIPKVYKNRAQALAQHLLNTGCVKWDVNGEISTDHCESVPMSHISDLIKDAIKSYVNFSPEGQQVFYTALATSNVPLGLLSNVNRRLWVQNFRQQLKK